MSMRRCAVCRASARKLTTVYVHEGAGLMKRARICNGCKQSTVRVHIGEARSDKCIGSDCFQAAVYCPECSRRREKLPTKKLLAELAKKLRGIATAYVRDGSWKRAEGLEQAADMVEGFEG